MKLTPVLLVESIENSLTFWTERMGWQRTVEVPEGDHLGFVIVVREGAELMLQTFDSVSKDEPKFAGTPKACRASLFVEVTDWSDTLKRLQVTRSRCRNVKLSTGCARLGCSNQTVTWSFLPPGNKKA